MASARRARIRLAVVMLATVQAVLLYLLHPAGAAAPGLPATVVAFNPPVSTGMFPGIDYGATSSATDDRYAKTKWRIVQRTGNCCETYLTTTPTGRLLDFGGSYINYSDDRGLTWHQVQPVAPLVNGEGAIVAAPGGDVLGVEWDPYSGDHLQTYKFEGDTQTWTYTETPLHSPFYDREWIAVVPGPITISGTTYDYVSFIKGGYPSKEVYLYSTDGLNYTDITSRALGQLLSGAKTKGRLPVVGSTLSDWDQPNTAGRMTPLGNGAMLGGPDLSSSWSLLNGKTFGWSAFTFADGSSPSGLYQIDSGGRINNVIEGSDGTSFDYRISKDGGTTWRSVTVPLPTNFVIDAIDFRANKAAGVGAVAVRALDQVTAFDQDFLFKLDIRTNVPRLTRMYDVGLGDTTAVAGVGNDIRFDFESVTIFPDGKVAMSFLDSTTKGPTATGGERTTPAMAIEMGTQLGGVVVPPPPPPPPVLGDVYASYSFDGSDEGWTADAPPSWSRSSPGTKTGTDDASTSSFGLEGPAAYVDNVDASVTSPPIATDPGLSVLQFWLKTNIEPGFDYVYAQWSSDGSTWHTIASYTATNDSYPDWNQITLGFDSPGGDIQVRFHFVSDLLCSALTGPAACGEDLTGARIDEVVVGKQAA